MTANKVPPLTPAQLNALFDILNHNETYREVEGFKQAQAIRQYGYPFTTAETPQRNDPPIYALASTSPVLQLLLTKCILTIPGMSDLPADFWPTHFQSLMVNLADANLSESYDKGTLGTRKTLATGASVIHEALTRGLLAGVAKGEKVDLKAAKYDATQARELTRAYDDCIRELVHGDLLNELFDRLADTADIEGHSPAVAAAVDYAILHIASLLHHIFVQSPEGQYLLKLIDSIYKLVPFSIVRSTLRIGNAATMLNGMIRVFLAKMGVGAVTNWFGITSGADDGMNLLQRIASMVLGWDASEFRKTATSTESSSSRPSKAHLAALKDYTTLPRAAQDALREVSTTNGLSIIVAILNATDPSLASSLTPAQHTACLTWLSSTLSARDRDEITRVLCKSQPDHLTAAVRGAVGAYEPMIRALHESLDLREHVTSLETFLSDFLETSKPRKIKGGGKGGNGAKKCSTRPPSVEDYVALLRRNKGLLFNYVHQFARDCTSLRSLFQPWLLRVLREFRRPQDMPTDALEGHTSNGFDNKLAELYAQLPAEKQTGVHATLDAHAAYLAKLDALSQTRMQRVLDQLAKDATSEDDSNGGKRSKSSSKASSKSSSPRASSGEPSMSGPGVYLMRWGALLDATVITSATAEGKVRSGREIKGEKALGKTTGAEGGWDAGAIAREEAGGVPSAPEAGEVMSVLGEGFRGVVRGAIGRVEGRKATEKGELIIDSEQEAVLAA